LTAFSIILAIVVGSIVAWKTLKNEKEDIIQRCGGDEILAERMIKAGRLAWAEARVELHQREERHMCIETGCRRAVAGQRIFAHCEEHLDNHEKRLHEDQVEVQISKGLWPKPLSDSPFSKVFDDTSYEREFMQGNISKKEAALADAHNLLNDDRAHRKERRAFLPTELRERIERRASGDTQV
jgi:hypothetical protein